MDHQPKDRHAVDWLGLWILFSSWCSLSGWILSWFGCLDRWGYGLAFLVFLGGLTVWRGQFWLAGKKPVWSAVRIVRSRWLLPRIWVTLTLLALIGGLIYHANNYDYLTYRFPRVLHWCWEQKWYWIDTPNERLNFCATGFEWLMAPLFVFFQTDRPFFLINFVSYLLLPGLVFSVFRHLGISKRVSWWWMWVLPCGYCYILQAASAGNDAFAAVYLLAALHYVFQARDSQPAKNLAFSCLSIALLTGAKASNAPLVLPWLIAVAVHGRYFLRACRPGFFTVTCLVAGMISILPIALLNIHFTGNYTGDPQNLTKARLTNPVSGIIGNGLQITVDNLSPPLWPGQIGWKARLPASLKSRLERDFPRLDARTVEMQIEEGAGVGLGVVACVGFMLTLGWQGRGTRRRLVRNWHSVAILGGAFVALLAFMATLGSEATSRLIAPYYPPLIAGVLVLASVDGAVVRRPLCQVVGCVAMLSALPSVIFNPSRPLFPTGVALPYLKESGVAPSAISRFDQVYRVYSTRFDNFRDLRVLVPTSERAVGVLQGGDDAEVSLWLPFGSREAVDVIPDEGVEKLRARGIHYVFVSRDTLAYRYRMNIEELMKKWPATQVAQKNLILKVKGGEEIWYLIHCP